MTNSIAEIEKAACILAVGSNTTVAHPVIGYGVKRAVRRGTKLIVANPKEIELCRVADVFLRQKPGTDVALLMGMMRVIVEAGLADTEFIKARCEDYDAFCESLDAFDLDFVERNTGVDREKIVEAARLYAENSPASILYAMGITQHTYGTDNVMAVANLALLTGNMGKPSAGVNPLRGQNNVQGACDMGALPNVYPGYQKVVDPKVQAKFEAAWDCELSDQIGLTHTVILDAAYDGKIEALYLVGENPVLSEANASHVEVALRRTKFLVVEDIFMTETAEHADVVLPAVTFAEKEGTFTNTERRVQRVRQAIEPAGDSRTDWWITCEIAKRMGAKGFDFATPEQIMAEIASVTPSYGGITYERIEEVGLQWPCPTAEHPGTPFLHAGQFARGKGRFVPLKHTEPAELPDDEYPLTLTTDRSLFHFHTSTMSRKVAGLEQLDGRELLRINPVDADTLGIADGETVQAVSRRGQMTVTANVTDVCPPGVVSASFHFTESRTNVLTNPALDPVAKIPATKVCAIRVEKLPAG